MAKHVAGLLALAVAASASYDWRAALRNKGVDTSGTDSYNPNEDPDTQITRLEKQIKDCVEMHGKSDVEYKQQKIKDLVAEKQECMAGNFRF